MEKSPQNCKIIQLVYLTKTETNMNAKNVNLVIPNLTNLCIKRKVESNDLCSSFCTNIDFCNLVKTYKFDCTKVFSPFHVFEK